MTDDPLVDVRLDAGTARAQVDPAHARRLCDGHFPGDPLVPGAYLVALMADLAGRLVGRPGAAPAEVVRCTFLSPTRPDEPLELRARLAASSVETEVWTAATCRARASFRFGGGA